MLVTLLYVSPTHICTYLDLFEEFWEIETQVPSMTLFDKKMVRRCGVWQIDHKASQINPLRAESVSNFGIFLNFNFPKNTFKYSKSNSQDTSR